MEEKNITQEIFDKIKDTKPKPRWQFLLKDYLIWLAACLALVISSLAFSVVIYMLINNDWDVYGRISSSLWEFIFLTLPYFWLLFLGMFILITYYNFKQTKKGYKYPLSKVFLVSLGLNVLLGVLLYNIGIGQAIDNAAARRVPFYKQIINPRWQIWSQTEDGFLGGVVRDIDDQYIIIEDIEGNIWTIKHFNTTTPSFMRLEVGQPVRIIGQKIDSQNFEMHVMLPMRGMKWIRPHHIMLPPPEYGERNF